MTRKAIFDAVRDMRGHGFSVDDVLTLDMALDKLGVPKDATKRTMREPEAFFAEVRKVTGPLDETQVDVINRLLASAAHWSVAWLAYGLATAWHEARLKPIEEIGKGRGLKYGAPGKHGQVAYGRGLVQLTWDYNYALADLKLGLNGALIKNYALALDPKVACDILVRGMEEGWFTGKSLVAYLPTERGTLAQFQEARRIINGTDRAAMIAGLAAKFQNAVSAGGWA